MLHLLRIILLLTLVFTACQSDSHASMQKESSSATVTDIELDDALNLPPNPSINRFFKSGVSAVVAIDSEKKLAKIAQLRFKVKDALKSSLTLEQIAIQQGGFVLSSELKENVLKTSHTRVRKDSLVVKTTFQLHSRVVLRVPFQKLDTTLLSIGSLATVFHYRNVQATDVTLDFLDKKLAKLRSMDYASSVASDINKKGNALRDITKAREREFNAKTHRDIAQIERMRLEDKVKYSTVTVDFYQGKQSRLEMDFYEQSQEPWKPSFWTRLVKAVKNGFELLSDIVIGLLNSWPVSIMLLLAFLFLRKRYKK